MPINDPWNRRPMREEGWQFLDEELCFNLWNELGNVGRVVKELEERGVFNPDTGKPPSRGGVYIAALRYISKNIEESRQRIVEDGGDWAKDKFLYLLWVVDRMQQSNTLGSKARREFNAQIVPFAESYLTQEEYYKFQHRLLEIIPDLDVVPVE